MIFWWAAGERIGGASAATISRGEAAYYFKSASTAATSGWPGTNPRLVRWTSSRPPISPSPCSAGYLGRSRQIRSATPPSFLSGKREVFLSRCAQRRASELLKLLPFRRVFPLSPPIAGASDELGSCRRQLERVQRQGSTEMGQAHRRRRQRDGREAHRAQRPTPAALWRGQGRG